MSAQQDFQLDESGIKETVMRLSGRQFFKSMTTRRDHRVWQDVVHMPICEHVAYVKLQIADDMTVVISFKEK